MKPARLWPDLQARILAATDGREDAGGGPLALPGPPEHAVDLVVLPLVEDGRVLGALVIGEAIADEKGGPDPSRLVDVTRLIESVPEIVWLCDGEGNNLWSSRRWSAYTGLDGAASLGAGWLQAVHPDDRAAVPVMSEVDPDNPPRFEYRLREAGSGRYRWFRVSCAPVRNAKGAVTAFVGTSTDIDDLRQLQESQRILVAELQHRTRNILALVRAVARQTLHSTRTTEQFQAEFQLRLDALARVQGLLSRAGDQEITIRDLVTMELEALGAGADIESVAPEVSGPPVPLRASKVQILALALHELATNARKHGALMRPGGRLSVTWRLKTTRDRRRWLAMEWRETGTEPIDPKPERRGYGRDLIDQALPYQLGARTSFNLTGNGLTCKIELPITE